jgi:hypothetical protein
VDAAATRTASEVLDELLRRGYTLSVKTRVELHAHKVGPQSLTYADRLYVEGPRFLTDDLRGAIRANRDELLAAACVLNPPAPWLQVLSEHDEPMTPTEVADALGKSFNAVKQRLWHMSTDGQVSAADGRYSTVTRNRRNRRNPDAVTVTPVTGVTSV